jgi:Leucine-rich repeat (LRR) protein
LANNQIQTLKSTEFVHNPKLSQLTISNNPLDFLLSGCILNSDGSELDCKNRLGAATNINFQNLPTATIKHMDFSNNNIITINKEMWKPIENVTLERLKANQKGFAFHYRSLEKLQLQNNKITSLHTGSHVDMFKKLHDLKILYAYGNEIVEPYPTREQVLSNKMKLVESQMGFCYLGGCRYVDIGCKLDLNPPGKDRTITLGT